MIRLMMKKFNMILMEKLQKYMHYHQAKLINVNVLQVKKIFLSNQKQIIGQAKFIYSPLGKAIEKQTKAIEDQGEKQIKSSGPMNFSN